MEQRDDVVQRAIYGEASLTDAAALVEDGIDIAPLPFSTRRARDN